MPQNELHFCDLSPGITRDGACGGTHKREYRGKQQSLLFSKISDNNPIVKRASVGGGSGPLIPRSSGFNGGIVFDCPRFARVQKAELVVDNPRSARIRKVKN